MKNIVSPKARVVALGEMVRPGEPITVRGVRVKGRGGGYFLAEISAGERVIARSRDRDWRKAYKGLEIELSKIGIF
jgi:hypothetical protein